MIPLFPNFKPLELSDKEAIENYTKHFPPYSDFNFVSMWSWDIKGEIRISDLNSNLIVRFADYVTGEQFYSFIGTNKVNETVEALLLFSEKEGVGSELKLVPENCINELDTEKFLIQENNNHHDYILPVECFINYNTKKTRTKNNSVKQLLKNHSPVIKKLDFLNQNIKNDVYQLFEKWSKKINDPLDCNNELDAINRYVESMYNFKNNECFGVYIDTMLAGFCLTEIHDDIYATIHFCKADTDISSGIYAYLLQKNAHILCEKKCFYINLEQDLGIESLRKWKSSHGTHTFLKKYNIEYNTLH